MASPPLKGLRVLEFAGLAPGPFAGMLLADAGATVLRIDRPTANAASPTPDLLARRKASLPLNLKSPRAVSLLHALIPKVDVLIDPFRPGVLEKLNLGPAVLRGINPRLIYARLTGFRRDGKYAHMAGHDINYLAVSGVLAMLGRKGEKPYSPINLVADFAGGGAALVNGILLALLSRTTTGEGQVVEANMVDGSSYIATFPRYTRNTPLGDQPRGENILDGGCPWYDTYRTKDGGYMSVGALEPQFFAALLQGLGLQDRGWQESRFDRDIWPEIRRAFEETFAVRTRAEWEAVFDGTEACCVPVLGYGELEADPAREGDQRPMVDLKGTPCLDPFVEEGEGGEDKGKRGGYTGNILETGHGGAEVLENWAGWTRGREFELEAGGLVWKDGRPRL